MTSSVRMLVKDSENVHRIQPYRINDTDHSIWMARIDGIAVEEDWLCVIDGQIPGRGIGYLVRADIHEP